MRIDYYCLLDTIQYISRIQNIPEIQHEKLDFSIQDNTLYIIEENLLITIFLHMWQYTFFNHICLHIPKHIILQQCEPPLIQMLNERSRHLDREQSTSPT